MIEAALHNRQHAVRDSLQRQIDSAREFPFQAEASLKSSSPTRWLRSQPNPLRLVWSSRGKSEIICGVGSASTIEAESNTAPRDIFDQCRKLLRGNEQLKFFGGFAFRRDRPPASSEWQPFGVARFWLPRIVYDGEIIRVTVVDSHDRVEASEALHALNWDFDEAPGAVPSYSSRDDLPNRDRWGQSVDRSLELFREEVLDKVVLARKATFAFPDELCPVDLTEKLAAATHACYHFCFQLDDGVAFLGATPERLFKRTGRNLASEVVAGTRRRDDDETEDLRLAEQLLGSTKDQLEHDIVRKSIRQRLHAYVETLEVDSQASILRLAKKQHLFSRVAGTLKPDVHDGCLIERLHPTPAVGGYPTENALEEIDRLEPFERGWYAGPVGYIGADEAEFAVAIRSGLVRGQNLSLYSGAGIVPGSTPELEWEEIEHKIGDFLDIIQRAK